MQRMVGAGTLTMWRDRPTRMVWNMLRRLLGLPPTDQFVVLGGLVAALKAESEAALGSPISIVSVSAPWVTDWEEDIPADSVVNDALAAAGLAPWTFETSWPIYLGEVNAVLAANGLQHCRLQWCGVPVESAIWRNITYFIR